MSVSAAAAPNTAGPAGPERSLLARVLSGVGLVAGGMVLTQGLRLVSNIVMTDRLDPEAFGLMGIAFTLTVLVGMLTDVGVTSSVVRSDHGDDPAFLRTAWVTSIARNALIFLAVCLIAVGLAVWRDALPPGSIYANPLTPFFLVGAGLQVLVSGFLSMNMALAGRNMRYGRVVAVEVAAQATTIPVMVLAYELGAGPWSLLVGAGTAALVLVGGSHLAVPGPRMGFEWRREHFSEIFSFGKWLLIASLFGFVLNRGDQLIFGWLFEEGAFSLYVIAALWITAVIGVASSLLGKVLYPALAEALRRDPASVDRTYKRLRLLADAAALSAFVGVVLLIEPFFDLIYDPQYQAAAPIVRLLAVSFLFLPYRLVSTVILVEGRSRDFTWVTGITAAAMVAFVVAGHALYGETGAIVGFALCQAVAAPVAWRCASDRLTFSWTTEARMMVLAAAGLAGVLSWG